MNSATVLTHDFDNHIQVSLSNKLFLIKLSVEQYKLGYSRSSKIQSVRVHFFELLCEDQRNDRHQLNKDVQCWSRGVLQGVSYCVSHHSRFVNFRSLHHSLSVLIDHCATLNILLGIVPSTTGIGGRDGQLNSADDGPRKEPGN
jgi:hypothetical protein